MEEKRNDFHLSLRTSGNSWTHARSIAIVKVHGYIFLAWPSTKFILLLVTHTHTHTHRKAALHHYAVTVDISHLSRDVTELDPEMT